MFVPFYIISDICLSFLHGYSISNELLSLPCSVQKLFIGAVSQEILVKAIPWLNHVSSYECFMPQFCMWSWAEVLLTSFCLTSEKKYTWVLLLFTMIGRSCGNKMLADFSCLLGWPEELYSLYSRLYWAPGCDFDAAACPDKAQELLSKMKLSKISCPVIQILWEIASRQIKE